VNFIVLAAFALFAYRRFLTYLHIFQQEEYDSVRFSRWLVLRTAFDIRATAFILLIGFLEFAIVLSDAVAGGLVSAALVIIAVREKDPRKASKKKLVLTPRAQKVLLVAAAILAVCAISVSLASSRTLMWIIPVQEIPFTLVVANLLLTPFERRLQQRFWNEAHSKLVSLKPVVVGITGSYGKTSTKHLLGHILELQAPTLITPGSVNTPMGIARIVREQLGPHHRFFVCEMGAYGPGSIARLCRLAPPNYGVITAIGMAHYERFKTLDTVASAKFELAVAAAANHGKVIVAAPVLQFQAAANFYKEHRDSTLVVGPEAADLQILSSSQTETGIQSEVIWKGAPYLLKAPIYGQHHASNMAIAFATACVLGVMPEDAVVALASVPQISHRLEVKRGTGGATLIDDAYNSNPVGFHSALHLLSALRKNGGRRVLVTPGMVEMGTRHDEEHRNVGRLAGEHVDVLLPVVPTRIATLTDGFRTANPKGVVVECDNFAAAQKWMDANLHAEDVVLLENDLPDLYEKRLLL
jgi:UDP-N-acetylmuramoyl-tripeptide--D-alanyl-D-alanine ligase